MAWRPSTINGQPVRVWPNGAWLAWIAIPPDSVMHFTLSARTAADSAVLVYDVRRAYRFIPRPGSLDRPGLGEPQWPGLVAPG